MTDVLSRERHLSSLSTVFSQLLIIPSNFLADGAMYAKSAPFSAPIWRTFIGITPVKGQNWRFQVTAPGDNANAVAKLDVCQAKCVSCIVIEGFGQLNHPLLGITRFQGQNARFLPKLGSGVKSRGFRPLTPDPTV